MVAAGELTISGLSFGMTTTRTLEIPLCTALAAAEQEECEKDQDQYTTSNRTTNDVLLIAR
jgi:hypothetical protein